MAMLKVFGYILAYFAVWAAVLAGGVFALEALAGDPQDYPEAMLAMVFGALIVIGATSIPFLDFAMRRSFVFAPAPGTTPVPEAELRDDILAINSYDVPVVVTRKENGRLVIHWNYVDGEVWGILAMHRIRQVYELHVRLDGDRKEAFLTDVRKSVRWGASPAGVRLGMGFSRGYLVGVEVGAAWGIRRDFSVGKAYSFKFNPAEIKRPVLNTIVASGWTARYALW